MKTTELRSTFFKYIFFNILSTIGVSVYILIDTYFISKGMGADGLTALNLCLPVFSFLNGFGLMLGMGSGSRFSMLYCRVERDETDRIFTNAFYAVSAIAAGFVLCGLFLSRQITALLGADSSVFELAHGYLKTVLLFAPAFLFNHLLVCFLRNDGAPRLAMAGVLGSSFANIVLDYVFIFRLNWGMEGAALATCISPIISMAIMSGHFLTGWNAFRLRLIRPSAETIRDAVSLGLHAFTTECSGGVVLIVFNYVIYRLSGNTGIAAYGVIANLAIVFTAVFTGLSSGVQPLMCKYHGRQSEEASRYLLRLSIHTAIFLSVLAYFGVYLNTDGLVAVFNGQNDTQLTAIARSGMQLYFLFMPFMGMNSVLSVYFTSCEKPFFSQLISLLRGTVLVIPLAFMFYRLRMMNGIWLTVPIAELLTAAAALTVYAVVSRSYKYSIDMYRYLPKQKTGSRHPY